jgi:inner membrane protein
MANGTAHMIAGGVVGATVLVHERHKENEKIELGEFLIAVAIGIFFGLLADIVEPAISPNHRAFFHSVALAGIIGWVMYKAYSDEETSLAQQAILLIGAAYLSHLVLDAATPRGLPLLGA